MQWESYGSCAGHDGLWDERESGRLKKGMRKKEKCWDKGRCIVECVWKQ